MIRPASKRHVSAAPTLAIAILLGALGSPAVRAQSAQPKLPLVTLSAGIHVIHAELAQSEEQRALGLMYRRDMAPNEGMLFVFERAGVQCFWMRNTLLPLSVAFVADDGTIVNLDDMKPLTDTSHCSTKPVRYVLEMNQGWFAKMGISAGAALSGAAFNQSAR